MKLQVPAEQRFTCAQCGACCRGGWAIVVTAAEVERYRAIGAARWYADPDLPGADPFLPAPGGHFRIRSRADGACGFLTDALGMPIWDPEVYYFTRIPNEVKPVHAVVVFSCGVEPLPSLLPRNANFRMR